MGGRESVLRLKAVWSKSEKAAVANAYDSPPGSPWKAVKLVPYESEGAKPKLLCPAVFFVLFAVAVVLLPSFLGISNRTATAGVTTSPRTGSWARDITTVH